MRIGIRIPSLAASLLLALVALAVSAAVEPAGALSVSPTHVEMISAGSGARAQVVVRNDASAPLPVEATLQRFTLDENGGRKNAPAGEEFLVFPPQAMIPPKGSQVFRIQWVGEPLLARSGSYMLSISQIPVRTPRGRSGVQVALSFGVVINVAPPQATPQLRLLNAAVATGEGGRRVPAITVHNPTNVHALLPQSTIRLSGGAWSATLSPADLSERMGIGLVQPGQRRRFLLPVTVPASVGAIQATVEFNPNRR
jgi:P pilus assembly chaperone PapD